MLRRFGGTSSAERQGSVHVDGTPACGVAAAAADKAAALRSAPVPHPAPRPTIRDGTSHPAPRPTPRDGTSHPAPRQALRDGTSHPASPAVASARGDMTVALRSVRESQAAALAAASARRLALSALHVETLGSSPSGFFFGEGCQCNSAHTDTPRLETHHSAPLDCPVPLSVRTVSSRRVPHCAKMGRKRGPHPKSISRSTGVMLRRVGGTSSAERQGSV